MIFPAFDPAIFTIPQFHLGSLALGPFAIRWYALAYVAGILLGWRYCVGLVKNTKLWGGKAPTASVLQLDDLVLWITLGAASRCRRWRCPIRSSRCAWRRTGR